MEKCLETALLFLQMIIISLVILPGYLPFSGQDFTAILLVYHIK